MNRKERRKNKIKNKDPVYNMKQSDIKNIKNQAVDVAFKLMLGIPVMVLHDKYGWGGKKRLPEFGDYVLELYDSFDKGFLTLDDIEKTIYEETGISFVNKV